MVYRSTKTYGHELGLSAVFRQWRAESHCAQLHGYALAFHFVFEAKYLNANGWVIDFGGLKPLKQLLVDTFDHKLVLAADDPYLELVTSFERFKLANVVVLENGVGCEKFAKLAHTFAEQVLENLGVSDRVSCISAECREHGANSAIYAKYGK